jgi:large subunit ribosomal protein L30
MNRLKITQVRSAIRRRQNQKDTIRSLGIRRLNHTVEHDDTPAIRGMIATVSHLVVVEEVGGPAAKKKAAAKPAKKAEPAKPAEPAVAEAPEEQPEAAGETDAAAE